MAASGHPRRRLGPAPRPRPRCRAPGKACCAAGRPRRGRATERAARPTAPLAFAPRPQAPFVAPRVAPRPFVVPPRAPRIGRGPSIAHALVARRGPDVHPIRAARPELRPEVAFKGADRRPERPELAIPRCVPRSGLRPRTGRSRIGQSRTLSGRRTMRSASTTLTSSPGARRRRGAIGEGSRPISDRWPRCNAISAIRGRAPTRPASLAEGARLAAAVRQQAAAPLPSAFSPRSPRLSRKGNPSSGGPEEGRSCASGRVARFSGARRRSVR